MDYLELLYELRGASKKVAAKKMVSLDSVYDFFSEYIKPPFVM